MNHKLSTNGSPHDFGGGLFYWSDITKRSFKCYVDNACIIMYRGAKYEFECIFSL